MAENFTPKRVMQLREKTLPGFHSFLEREVISRLYGGRDISVLDLGCGSGAWLQRLRNRGLVALYGLDRSAPQLDGYKMNSADLEEDNWIPDGWPGQFDLITMIEIIEHVQNPFKVLAKVRSLLSDGGRILITSPNIYSLRSRTRFLLNAKMPAFERCTKSPIEEDHLHPIVLEAFKRKVVAPLDLQIERLWTYSADGSIRRVAKVIIGVLRLLLKDELPGDTLCLLLKRK
jgi:SAM-dependent methyltransferase